MNLHRRGETGCPYITDHFKSCCKGKSYSIQIIEVLSVSGHDENGIVDENIYRLRLGRKDFWMKILRTNFPCGLNETSKDLMPGAPVVSHFCHVGRSGEINNRCHKKRNRRHAKVSLKQLFNF